jgi:predicted RNA binding protein YcfA (HicA-like mRNA interferase family)/predicted RNase H-like HicB family nuclease
MRTYTAIVEQCPDTSLYVGYVPGFPGAHTQAETVDELNRNLREVLGMLLEEGEPKLEAEFVGTQTVTVPVRMGNVPVLKPREVISILEALGFAEIRQRGSHKQFRHKDGRGTTVPVHPGRDIADSASTDCEGHIVDSRGILKHR